ncbi:MAG: NmrA family NAD(P)-binding protein [Aurantibacter sp.]
MKTEILITGATGTTSQYAIQHLVEKGVKVRAMVRSLDHRSEQLQALGVEVVKGNFFDGNSLKKALHGIKRAYFLYPFRDYLPKAAAYFAKAAKQAGVELVVSMSQMGADGESPSPATQNHYATENILDWADIGAVHIRPGLFAWNYLGFAAPTVADHQKFYYPVQEARYTIVHPQDVGEVVAEILLDEDPRKHIGQKYDLSGGRTHSGQEVADDIGALLNTEVEYVPITVDQWIDSVKDHPTINSFLAKHLREFSTEVSEGRFDMTTDVVKNITGHEPRSFSSFLEENKQFFLN